MAEPFIFKQFQLEQGRSAFKLGTDSVVLGAWLPANNYQKVLDIGGGSGILSLMMAQRFSEAEIISVELDEGSSKDSANNFAQSKWHDRLVQQNMNIHNWCKQNPGEEFDLIISNPPYFTNQLQNHNQRKADTRHTNELDAIGMSHILGLHLQPFGYFGCILPADVFDIWSALFELNNIHLNVESRIKSFEDTGVIRKAGLFSKQNTHLHSEEVFLYNKDKSRSKWYAELMKEFYIK